LVVDGDATEGMLFTQDNRGAGVGVSAGVADVGTLGLLTPKQGGLGGRGGLSLFLWKVGRDATGFAVSHAQCSVPASAQRAGARQRRNRPR